MGSWKECVDRLKSLACQASALSSQDSMRLAAELSTLAQQLRALPSQTPQAVINEVKNEVTGEGDAAVCIPNMDQEHQPNKKQRKGGRQFDFGQYQQRYVALELMYVGWQYQGFARQDNTDNTIEGHLFSALRKTRLIPEDADIGSLRYSRCGRTDKGVSALGQVVALLLRSNARKAPKPQQQQPPQQQPSASCMQASPSAGQGQGPSSDPSLAGLDLGADSAGGPQAAAPCSTSDHRPGPGSSAAGAGSGGGDEEGDTPLLAPEELDYPRVLNRALPPDIRVLGWADAPTGFSARFSASYREYKYFITSHEAGPRALDLGAMRAAAAQLVGSHDFRNFCKVDPSSARSFRRTILDFRIEAAGAAAHGCQVYAMTVRGTAFLYHQVRCMAAVLLMVGRGQEQPGVVARLLDVKATPCKPQYAMAPEEPLLLYACGFPQPLAFRRTAKMAAGNDATALAMIERHLVGAALAGAVAGRLSADPRNEVTGEAACKADAHIPLMRRATEPSVEEKMRSHGIHWVEDEEREGAMAMTE